MVAAETVATWMGTAVGAVTLLGIAKSAYNGYVRGIVRGLLKLDAMCKDLEAMYQRQEGLIDALIALAYAQKQAERDVPIDRIEEEFEREEGPRRFLDDDDRLLRGGDD